MYMINNLYKERERERDGSLSRSSERSEHNFQAYE